MKKAGSVLIVLLLSVLLLAVVFLGVDFRIIRGQTEVESQASTYTVGFGINQEGSLPLEQKLDVYIIGTGQLAGAFQDELEEALQSNPYIGDVQLVEGEPVMAEDSVLILRIEDKSIFWTPIYSRSQLEVQLKYASDGEIAWMDEEVVHMTNDGPTLRYEGDFQTRSSAFGLMSLPGYYGYLCEELSQKMAESLEASTANAGK